MASSGAVRAGKAFVEFFAETNPLYRGMDKIASKLKQVGTWMTKTGAGIAGAGAAVFVPLAKLLTDAAERGRDVQSLSEQFSITTQTMSALAAGAEGAGVSFGEFSGILNGLSSRVLNNDQLLRDLQIDTMAFAQLPIDQALEKVATQLSLMTNPARQAADAMTIFGEEAGRKLLPYLKEGAAGIARLKAEGKDFAIDPETAKRGTETMRGFSLIMKQVTGTLLDVGSALLPTTDQVKEVVAWIKAAGSSTREWIAQNKAAIQTAFAVGAGLLVVGTALAVLGTGFNLAGMAIAGLVVAAKLLFATLFAIFSPAGLIIAGVAAIGVGIGYLVSQTQTGQAGLASMKEGFQDMAESAKSSWEGISAALKNGDIAAAAKIGMLGLQVEWARLVLGLTQLWNGFKGIFLDTWRDMVAGASLLFNDLASFISKVLGKVVSLLLRGVAKVVKQVDSVKAAEITRMANEYGDSDKIEKERQATEDIIIGDRLRQQRESDASRKKDEDAARADLARVKDELAEAVGSAKADMGGKEFSGGGDFDDETVSKATNTTRALGDKVKGTFSTLAATQQLGVGDTRDPLKEGINSTAKNTAILPEMNRNMVEFGNALRLR